MFIKIFVFEKTKDPEETPEPVKPETKLQKLERKVNDFFQRV